MPTRFAATKWPSSWTNTSTPRTKANEISVVITDIIRPLILLRAPRRAHAPAPTDRASRAMRVHRALDHLGDRRKGQPPLEKTRHRDFVRGVQHDGQAALRPERPIRQAQARERVRVGRGELERAGRREIE